MRGCAQKAGDARGRTPETWGSPRARIATGFSPAALHPHQYEVLGHGTPLMPRSYAPRTRRVQEASRATPPGRRGASHYYCSLGHGLYVIGHASDAEQLAAHGSPTRHRPRALRLDHRGDVLGLSNNLSIRTKERPVRGARVCSGVGWRASRRLESPTGRRTAL